jgi:hypothetical protein
VAAGSTSPPPSADDRADLRARSRVAIPAPLPGRSRCAALRGGHDQASRRCFHPPTTYVTDLVPRNRTKPTAKREAADAIAEISVGGGALVAWLTAPIAIAVDAPFVASAL